MTFFSSLLISAYLFIVTYFRQKRRRGFAEYPFSFAQIHGNLQ